MNNNSKSKNDIFYVILLVLTMITMIIGITFTYFGLIASEKEDSTQIKTGTLSINYIDGKEIAPYLLMPIKEPTLDTKYSVYKKKFSVSSDGTLDQTLDIYIKVTKNEFQNNALKYALYDGKNIKISTGNIPSDEGARVLMSSGKKLKSNEKENFTVLIWLGENNKNQDVEKGKIFVGGFDITATQLRYK